MNNLASSLISLLKNKNLKLVAAESCTGGMLSSLITDISGASSVFEGGFITYSNDLKIKLLGVDEQLIAEFGAVSEQVARAMTQGALEKTGADIAISITGIAGPNGGTLQKPVGLVYIAVGSKNNINVEKTIFTGNRAEIRKQSVALALNILQTVIKLS
jgi:PncC family amidohydrolase